MSQDTVTITVNGREVEAELGHRLLDVLREQGLDIPTLCHDDRLTPYGGCRLCVVERKDGRGGLIPACSTPVQRGMVVETDTAEVIASRRRTLSLLVLNHRMECPICERSGDCRFQDLIYVYGADEDRLPFELIRRPRDEASPFIVRDPEKCILCGRCVRLCEEVQGVAEIGLVGRGLDARVATMLDRPLDCEFCGQCVNACPVGALVATPFVSEVPAWMRERVETTCSLCSCGCTLSVERFDGRILAIRGAEGVEPNRGKLCAKGWLAWDLLDAPERLERPLVRRGEELVPTEWDDALELTAALLRKARSDGKGVRFVLGARLTCEDAWLAARLAEELGGTAALGPEGGLPALVDGVGSVWSRPTSTAGIEDLRRVDAVIVAGSDPTRTHPLIKTELVQRLVQDERPVGLVCSAPAGLERHATTFLRTTPGGEAAALWALAARLAEGGQLAQARQLPGGEEFLASLRRWTGNAGAAAAGVAEEELSELVASVVEARSGVVVVPTARGLWGDEAALGAAAAALCAALGPGWGLLVAPEKANLQGCLDIGLRGGGERFFREAVEGEVGALVVIASNPAGTWPRSCNTEPGFQSDAALVALDPFMSETGRRADVVLPTALLMERQGTLVSAGGTARTLVPVHSPPAGVSSDGAVLRRLASRLGVQLPDQETVRARVAQALAGASPPEVMRLPAAPEPESRRRPEGLVLDTGPSLFHSGSVTTHSRRMGRLAPPAVVSLRPEEAASRGLSEGDTVRVVVGEREALMTVRVERRAAPGCAAVARNGWIDGSRSLVEADGQVSTVELRRA